MRAAAADHARDGAASAAGGTEGIAFQTARTCSRASGNYRAGDSIKYKK